MGKILLVIDLQKGFINQHTKNLPKKIANFISKNKNLFDQILFSQYVNNESSNWVKLYNWKNMQKSPEIDIVPQLQKFVSKNNLFQKKGFSCFKSNKFNKFIKNKNIKLYICGLDTHACVYCTVMEAFELNFSIKIISDLCAASHGIEYHNQALNLLKRNLGDKILIKSTNFN